MMNSNKKKKGFEKLQLSFLTAVETYLKVLQE